MIWHESSGPDVAEFAKTCDVALLPVGCVEMHGPHCPSGCDGLRAERVCRLAEKLEPCIVLPTIWYNINDQMKCYPGAISIPHRIVADMHRSIFRECARNGFKKIICYLTHGGGDEPITLAQAEMLDDATSGIPVDYQVFRVGPRSSPQLDETDESFARLGGHGGADETSEAWDGAPGTVEISRVIGEEGPYIRPMAAPAYYRVDWIRNVPKGFNGRPEFASQERGKKLNSWHAERLAEMIRVIKTYDPESSP